MTLKQWRKVHDFFDGSDFTINDIEPSALKYDEVQAGNIKHTIELKNQAGQTIIPIPILGAVIGNSVGTVLYQIGKDNLNKKENAFFEHYISEQSVLDESLENKYGNYIRMHNEAMTDYCSLLEKAFSPVPEIAFSGSIRLAKNLNIPVSEILSDIGEIDRYFMG